VSVEVVAAAPGVGGTIGDVTETLPLAEWPDPSSFQFVTHAAVVPSTVTINPAEGAGSGEMFVLTIDVTQPGKMPPGEPTQRQVLCIDVDLARQIAAAFQTPLESSTE